MRTVTILLLMSAFLICQSTVEAADISQVIAARTSVPVTIDGRLDDDAWHDAQTLSDFTIAGKGTPAKQGTKAWVVFDNRHLYVAFDCDDNRIVSLDRQHDGPIWEDDCVEVFLSPRFRLDEYIHIIINTKGDVYDARGRESTWNPTEPIKTAVHKRSGGYVVEIAIPIKGILDDTGLKPRRGDLWGVKLVREDYSQHYKPIVEATSWSRIASAFADSAAWGNLYFESTNVLPNGGAEIDTDANGIPDGWSFYAKDHYDKAPPNVSIDTNVKAAGRQSCRIDSDGYFVITPNGFGPRDGRSYRITGQVKIQTTREENVRVKIAAVPNKNQVIATHSDDFVRHTLEATCSKSNDIGFTLTCFGGKGTVWVDDLHIQMVRVVLEPGLVCLTGNAEGSLADRNAAPDGATYTYRETLTDAPFFPFPVQGKMEDGRSAGHVPFSEGRLTDGDMQNLVVWPVYWLGLHGVGIEFDLKTDFIIRKIEVYSATNSMCNFRLYAKDDASSRYGLLALRGHPNDYYVEARGYVGFDNLNVRARHVRLNMRHQQMVNHPGISEILIWGTPVDAASQSPKPTAIAVDIPGRTKREPRKIDLPMAPPLAILPQPQEMQTTDEVFTFSSSTRIVTANSDDRLQLTAEALQSEIKSDTGVELPIRTYRSESDLTDAIVIGEGSHLPALSKLSPPNHEQGYSLKVGRSSILVAGASPRGTFYGSMTLLQLLQVDGQTWSVSGVVIRDWPTYQYRFSQTNLKFAPLERGRNLLRAYARYKVNYVSMGDRTDYVDAAVPLIPVAEQYFVNLMPSRDYRMAAMLHYNKGELIERAPDESLESMGRSRRNVCPSNPKTWELYQKLVDEVVPRFNSDVVVINMDEMYQPDNGSRWNVCSLCRSRNMRGYELLAETINRCQAAVGKYGKRVMLVDSPLYSRGISNESDTQDDWRKAQSLIDKRVMMYDWHGEIGESMAANGYTVLRWGITAQPSKFQKGMQGWFLNGADGPFSPQRVLDMTRLMWNPNATELNTPDGLKRLQLGVTGWSAVVSGIASPVARRGDKPFFMIDLRSVANRSLTDETANDGAGWIDEGPLRSLDALKTGKRELNGIPFDIIDGNEGRQCVMVHNPAYLNATLPDRCEIPVNRKAASLLFLHTLDRSAGQNYICRYELAGYYFVTYKDGSADRVELKYQHNITNWDKFDEVGYAASSSILPDAQLVWRGVNAGGDSASLYATEWVNPRPDQTIDKIVFVATQRPQAFNPILLAVTGIEPRPVDISFWASRRTELMDITSITPSIPTGNLIDLGGGRRSGPARYTSAGGVTLQTGPIHETRTMAGGEYHLSRVDHLIERGSVGLWGYGERSVIATFPEPTDLTCVGIFARPREERYLTDFEACPIDYKIEVSPDGRSFEQVAQGKRYNSDEQGWRYTSFEPRKIKAVRVTVSIDASYIGPKRASYPFGLAGLRLYAPR